LEKSEHKQPGILSRFLYKQ